MKPPLPYIQRTRDKQGVPRYYYRRKGWPRTTLPSPLKDMKAFLAAYAAAEQRRAVERPDDGTLGALITAYLKSQDYRGLKPKSKETYNTTIAFLRSRPSVAMQVANIRRKHIKDLRDEIAETHIGKANMVVKVLRLLLSFAVDREWIVQNPALGVESIRGGEYRAWTDVELLAFEERWPRGTTERLIYELALGTGQRRGDIAKMTWGDVKDGGISVVQEKTGAKLWIPAHPSLVNELGRVPKRHTVIVATVSGRSYSADYLGTSFAKAIEDASLPESCVLHGLRKAAARRLAEAGCSDREIMSVTGHKSAKEVDRYTRQADQRVSARAAILKLTKNDNR